MADKPPPPPPPPLTPPVAPTDAATAPVSAPKSIVKPNLPQGNPALRALGLPNWRPKLPSRNWLIFFSIVGSFTGTLLYDRRQKKKEQDKWCTLVSHVAHETIPTNSTVRKVTVYLAAPPGDGLRVAREHFVEYVKPVLVAGGLDWDVVEGRREGEVRVGLAERIRKFRRRRGEGKEVLPEEDLAVALEQLRQRMGVQEWQGQKGDIVVGRHAWKEYVRGLHEGWLGPLKPPEPPPNTMEVTPEPVQPASSSSEGLSPSSEQQAEASTPASPPPKEEKKPAEPETPPVPPPHNTPSSYPSSSLSTTIPSELAASAPIHFSHILGFRNTPIRMYRFLTRRYLADDVGRQTAAVVLATYRPYSHSAAASAPSDHISDSPTHDTTMNSASTEQWEQQDLLEEEERSWWKKSIVRKPEEGEREWLDDIVVDARIGARMRKFELDKEDEDRAMRIGNGAAGVPGRRAGDVEGKHEETNV